jgi:DNA-binding LacI/PurR family transcriptional regulator
MERGVVTQTDVAKKAGVSFITVSRVINNNGYVKKETREKVLNAIKDLNYYTNFIGRALNMKSVNTIGVLMPSPNRSTIHTTEYYNLLMAGIEESTMAHGFDLILTTYQQYEPEVDYLRLYYQRKADGLILLTPDLSNVQIEEISLKNLPCVIIGDRPEDETMSFIDSDNFDGMLKATEFVISKGHRDIAYVRGDRLSRNERDRYDGFREALKKHNVPFREDLEIAGSFTIPAGQKAVQYIKNLASKPSVLMCANDHAAFGALSEARSLGIRVPDELAIVGFDGVSLTEYTNPPITTVKQPLFNMGFEASEALFDLLSNPDSKPMRKILPIELIVRGSC